jgi:hypothetical protein
VSFFLLDPLHLDQLSVRRDPTIAQHVHELKLKLHVPKIWHVSQKVEQTASPAMFIDALLESAAGLHNVRELRINWAHLWRWTQFCDDTYVPEHPSALNVYTPALASLWTLLAPTLLAPTLRTLDATVFAGALGVLVGFDAARAPALQAVHIAVLGGAWPAHTTVATSAALFTRLARALLPASQTLTTLRVSFISSAGGLQAPVDGFFRVLADAGMPALRTLAIEVPFFASPADSETAQVARLVRDCVTGGQLRSLRLAVADHLAAPPPPAESAWGLRAALQALDGLSGGPLRELSVHLADVRPSTLDWLAALVPGIKRLELTFDDMNADGEVPQSLLDDLIAKGYTEDDDDAVSSLPPSEHAEQALKASQECVYHVATQQRFTEQMADRRYNSWALSSAMVKYNWLVFTYTAECPTYDQTVGAALRSALPGLVVATR